jgi:hypothetical protein
MQQNQRSNKLQKEGKLMEAANKDGHEILNRQWMKQFTCGYGAIPQINLFPVEIAVSRLDARTREILAVPGALSSLLVTAGGGDAELARGPGARAVDFSFPFPYDSRPAQFKILLVGPRNTREILITR